MASAQALNKADPLTPEGGHAFDRVRLAQELLSLGHPGLTPEVAGRLAGELEADLLGRPPERVTPQVISEILEFKLKEMGILKNSPTDSPLEDEAQEKTEIAGVIQETQLPTLEKFLSPQNDSHEKTKPPAPRPPRAQMRIHPTFLKEKDELAEEALFRIMKNLADTAAQAEAKFPHSENPDTLAVEFFNCMANQEFYPHFPGLLGEDSMAAYGSHHLWIDVSQGSQSQERALAHAQRIWEHGSSASFILGHPNSEFAWTERSFGNLLHSIERALLDLPEKIRLPDRVGLHFPGEEPLVKKLINLALSGKYYPRFQISLGFEEGIQNPSLIGGIWNQCSPQLVFHTGAHAPALPRWSGGPYLRPLEACHLGSINLSFLASGKEVDWGKFRRIIRTAVHFLDNLFEVTTFPLEATRRETLNHRKIGLGVMGFAELLEKLGYPYPSEATLVLSEKLMGFLFQEAAKASRDLAKLRGAFPGFSEEHWRSHGGLRRHGNLGGMCSAPGLAQLAGVTPGLDPKNSLPPEGETWLQRVQGAWEAACDGSVGIHIPAGDSKSPETLKQDLQLAESLALKQLTLEQNFWIQPEELQENPETAGEIVETTETPDNENVPPSIPRPRPSVLNGRIKEFSLGSLACLITLSHDEFGPRELLLRAGKAGSQLNAQGEALSRLITLLFGMGMDSQVIADELSGIQAKGEEPTLAEVISRFLKEESQEENGEEEEEITEVVELGSVH